jgi:release factor glutamine methyltransferase
MSATAGILDRPAERLTFAGLEIEWDPRVLQPRPWTAEQGRWAAELAQALPAGTTGPILELCCGAGHIGLLAARTSGRPLVQVDRDPVAVAYARRNAAAAGVESEVRCGAFDDVLEPEERYDVVIADPPWLRTDQLDEFPEDPRGAVDGGADGAELIIASVEVALRHLSPRGHLVLQVGDLEQVATVTALVARLDPDRAVAGVRDCRPGGVLMSIGSKNGSTEEPQGQDEQGGEVSEVGGLGGAGEQIQPEDSVAAHPKDEDVQEGATGPDARTGNQDTDKDPQ